MRAILMFAAFCLFAASCPAKSGLNPIGHEITVSRAAVEADLSSGAGPSRVWSSTPIAFEVIPVAGTRVLDAVLFGHPSMVSSHELPPTLQSRGISSALALSSGAAGEADPVPGRVQHEGELLPDRARLVLTIEPDPLRPLLLITWSLFTTEIDAFSQLGFDDVFRIDVVDASGPRQLVEARSSDPRLFPVSDRRAADTGFDLYSQTPGAVPTEYGRGLPAAGMTGWRTSGFTVDASAPIQIEIEVRDVGDLLMDTQALIGSIHLSGAIPTPLVRGSGDCINAEDYCAALFPLPGTFVGNGNPAEPPWMCELGPVGSRDGIDFSQPQEFRGGSVQAIVADGSTRMPVVPAISMERDEVVISVLDADVPADGGLGSFGSEDRLEEITVPVIELGQGFWGGQAQYFAPESYWRPELDLETEYGRERRIQLQACFQNAGGTDRVCFALPIDIVRPDLVLMHGLWSSATAWDLPLGPVRSSDLLARAHDYSSSNASAFATNRFEPQKIMFDRCIQNRLSNTTFGAQFDFAGHSMGALLARVYLARAAPYNTIHRLFSLNSPHLGSPLANFLLELRDSGSLVRRLLLLRFLEAIGKPIDRGAIDDLAVGSAALMAIPETPVPSHALVGVGGTQWAAETLRDAPGLIGDVYRLTDFLSGASDLYEHLQHDLVVTRASQIGGLPAGVFTVFDGLGSIHAQVTENEEYSDRLFCRRDVNSLICPNGPGSDLINAQGTGRYGFFPAPASVSSSTLRKQRPPRQDPGEPALIEGGVQVVSPGAGQAVSGGETLRVVVESVPPFEATRIMLLSEVGVQVLDAPPFEFSLPIPADLVGTLESAAAGENAAGDYAISEAAAVTVESKAALMQIELSPGTVFLKGFDDRRQLTVLGTFDDDVIRDLSEPSTGTTYTTSDRTMLRFLRWARCDRAAMGS